MAVSPEVNRQASALNMAPGPKVVGSLQEIQATLTPEQVKNRAGAVAVAMATDLDGLYFDGTEEAELNDELVQLSQQKERLVQGNHPNAERLLPVVNGRIAEIESKLGEIAHKKVIRLQSLENRIANYADIVYWQISRALDDGKPQLAADILSAFVRQKITWSKKAEFAAVDLVSGKPLGGDNNETNLLEFICGHPQLAHASHHIFSLYDVLGHGLRNTDVTIPVYALLNRSENNKFPDQSPMMLLLRNGHQAEVQRNKLITEMHHKKRRLKDMKKAESKFLNRQRKLGKKGSIGSPLVRRSDEAEACLFKSQIDQLNGELAVLEKRLEAATENRDLHVNNFQLFSRYLMVLPRKTKHGSEFGDRLFCLPDELVGKESRNLLLQIGQRFGSTWRSLRETFVKQDKPKFYEGTDASTFKGSNPFAMALATGNKAYLREILALSHRYLGQHGNGPMRLVRAFAPHGFLPLSMFYGTVMPFLRLPFTLLYRVQDLIRGSVDQGVGDLGWTSHRAKREMWYMLTNEVHRGRSQNLKRWWAGVGREDFGFKPETAQDEDGFFGSIVDLAGATADAATQGARSFIKCIWPGNTDDKQAQTDKPNSEKIKDFLEEFSADAKKFGDAGIIRIRGRADDQQQEALEFALRVETGTDEGSLKVSYRVLEAPQEEGAPVEETYEELTPDELERWKDSGYKTLRIEMEPEPVPMVKDSRGVPQSTRRGFSKETHTLNFLESKQSEGLDAVYSVSELQYKKPRGSRKARLKVVPRQTRLGPKFLQRVQVEVPEAVSVGDEASVETDS